MLIKITEFTYAYLAFTLGLLLLYWIFFQFILKRENPIKLTIFCTSCCVILLWLSLNFSYQCLEPENPLEKPIGKGGFPFTCFYYPICCLGGDLPPYEHWPKFFINYGFWFALVGAAAVYFKEKFERKIKRSIVFYGILALALLVNEIGLTFVVFGYD